MNTLERIKQYLDYKRISNQKFEKIIGYSNGAFSSQLKNNRTIGVDKLEKVLIEFDDLNPNWLITGKGPMLVDELENTNMLSEPPAAYGKKEGIPIYDLVAGSNQVINESQAHEFINPGDLFMDAHAVMRVYGESMETKYPSGSFVPVKKLNDKRLIVYGQDYVIQTNEYRVLKRIQKSKDNANYLACSINEATYEKGELAGKLIHEPFDVLIDDIISISIVLGCFTRNQISNIY